MDIIPSSMRKTSIKIFLATLFVGLIFLVGGVGVVSASEHDDTQDTNNLTGLSCGIWGESELSDCLPIWTYYLVYKPASFLLLIAGKIFNYSLNLSIDKKYVSDPPFINASWIIIRDVSNMAFIFILLYTGIMTMLGKADWKGVVIKVIIIALLINFSLFFTKVVIDAGNILAVGIYSSMGSDPPTGTPRDLSAALVAAFEPQKFISAAGKVPAMDSIIVFIIAAIVNVAAAYALFMVALVFIGRLLAFWFLMIISPFAFISTTFPKGNKFQWWLDTLLAQAFVAPVFLFMLYLVMSVINSRILDSFLGASGTGLSDRLLMSVLVATLLVVALLKAKDLATSMAGDFGNLGAKIGAAAMGVAAGGAALTGAGAVAGLSAVGGLGKNADGTDKTGRFAAMARGVGTAGHMGRNLNFDVRNLPGGSHLGLGAGNKITSDSMQNSVATRIETLKEGMHANTPEARMAADTAKAKKKEDARVARAAARTPAGAAETARQAVEMHTARTTGHAAAVARVNQTAIDKRAKKAARVPELQNRITKINNSISALSTANNGNMGDALIADLKAKLRTEEANARVAEENAVRNPADGQAQVDSLRAKRNKESAEKDHKTATSATDDLEKLEKQLAETTA